MIIIYSLLFASMMATLAFLGFSDLPVEIKAGLMIIDVALFTWIMMAINIYF